MKVLLANKFFFLNGGSEVVFFQERDFLKKKGLDVVDFSMVHASNFPSDFSHFFVPNLDYENASGLLATLRAGLSFIHSRAATEKLLALVKQERPQIAHLHNIYHQLTPSIIALLKENGVKIILTLHDGKLICPAYLMLKDTELCTECAGRSFHKVITHNCPGSFARGLLLAAEAYWHKWNRTYDKVDLFLAPSRFLADLIVKNRVPSTKVKILKNGIDASAFTPTLTEENYVLYFGRLSKEKGIQTLLRAHSAMGSLVPLKVVGTGPLMDELRGQYTGTEFLGYKSGDELNAIIRNAAFVVVPSEWYENCSMVVLEAMAMGKPVIGSRIGGIPEQVEDGVTGFLFGMRNADELAEKMTILSGNPSLRQEMGFAARQKVEREYSLDAHCKGLLEIYNELLGKN